MKLEIIILAAGQGPRMKSPLPKVLHPVAGRPMLQHVVETAQQLDPHAIHVVVGHGGDQVRAVLEDYPLTWVEQLEQLGTGHAVLQALPAVEPDSVVLVLYGDVPLIKASTLSGLAEAATLAPALLTAKVADPAGYGRIVRDTAGALLAVVEHKDASGNQLDINEINTGVMAAPLGELAHYLPQVGPRHGCGRRQSGCQPSGGLGAGDPGGQ